MSPRSVEQNEALRAKSRAKILDSALALFARVGYERTTVRMIAQEAGVAQGLLYNYFAGKEDVLRALFAHSRRDVQQSLEAIGGPETPHEQLERYVHRCFEILRQNLSFWKLAYSVRMQPAVLAGLSEEIQAWTQTVRRILEALLTSLGVDNPPIEAEILFALIDGVSEHYALDPEHYPLDAVASAIVARYRLQE